MWNLQTLIESELMYVLKIEITINKNIAQSLIRISLSLGSEQVTPFPTQYEIFDAEKSS